MKGKEAVERSKRERSRQIERETKSGTKGSGTMGLKKRSQKKGRKVIREKRKSEGSRKVEKRKEPRWKKKE